MPKTPSLTRYARFLVHRKHYPAQIQIMRGHVRNPNAAVYNMLADCGARSKSK